MNNSLFLNRYEDESVIIYDTNFEVDCYINRP